jgi:hypothetical protein
MATLIVSALPARGRWRAGHFFGREQMIVEVDADQEAAIRADPLLRVFDDKPAAAPLPEPRLEVEEADVKPGRGKR